MTSLVHFSTCAYARAWTSFFGAAKGESAGAQQDAAGLADPREGKSQNALAGDLRDATARDGRWAVRGAWRSRAVTL